MLSTSSGARADVRTDARREFRAGMSAISEGRYDEGIEHLEVAYDTLPHPNVLYNIGLAHMYAGRPDEALAFFERYREQAPPGDQSEVEGLIRSLREAQTPAETPPPAETTTTPSGEGVALPPERQALIEELEASARSVRRMADEQNNDALRRQADELDAAAAELRRRASEEPAPTTTPLPAAPDTQSITPPARPAVPPPGKGTVRTGLYEEQVVSASRVEQSPLDAPNATAIITAQDIRMSGQHNLSQLLRRIAGVDVTTMAPSYSEVSIRGLSRRSTANVLLLWDGRPIRKDYSGGIWVDSIPIGPDDIERVEIIRGPASALYGADAYSGIINIVSRAPGTGKSYVLGRGGNKNYLSGGMGLYGRDGKLAWRYGTAFQRLDHAKLMSDPKRVDVVPFYEDPDRASVGLVSNGELTYDIADRSVATFGASLTMGVTTTQGQSRLTQITSKDSWEFMTWGSVTTPIGIRLGTWFDSVYALSGQSYQIPGAVAVTERDNILKNHQAEVDLSWSDTLKLLVPQTLTVGVTYRYKQISWGWIDREHTQNHVGGYLQDIIQLARPLRLQVGARVDRHPLLPKVQFSPRGSLVYRFLGEQSLRFSAGRAFRSPTFLESYVGLPNETPLRGVTAWGIGNKKLDPESITSVELGYQNQQSDYFALEANAYYNWVKDAILLTNVDTFTLRDYAERKDLSRYRPEYEAFPLSALSFANERATYRQIGGELGVRMFPVKGVDVYANYSVHDTRPTDRSKTDPVRAQARQASLHKVNTGFQYRAPFGLDLSADLSWLSPQIWVEQVTDTERGVRWQRYDIDALFYLSARIGYRLFDNRLELGLVGNNLLFQDKRQHPYGQPLDTRVYGSAKVWF